MTLAPLRRQVEQWIACDIDPMTAAAAGDLLDKAELGDTEAAAELAGAFTGTVQFGTAGLRAPLGPGPARMNRMAISRTAAGLAEHLAATVGTGRVLIGFDARYNSDVFARDTAEILAGQGFQAVLTEAPVPTPLVAFGLRSLGCVAAVVVTASHNPSTDNGFKVYLGDGHQIVPPADSEIAARIAAIEWDRVRDLNRNHHPQTIGAELVTDYLRSLITRVEPGPREVSWVYTPLHGVGGAVVHELTGRLGFPACTEVPEQARPDSSFPTVRFPNPEEPGTLDLALARAHEVGAELVVANDPDADRVAVAIPQGRQWRMLTGDELGCLLADDLGRRGVRGVFASSVVSGTMLRRIAEAYDCACVTTLTGFKWIARVPGLRFGYEEAIGYCCEPDLVGDKDGISALVRILELAARLREQHGSIADRLDELSRRYGVHRTAQLSVRLADPAAITSLMQRVRLSPPRTLCGQPVTVLDLAEGSDTPALRVPPTDAVLLEADTVRAVVRPSGTEPKLKVYLEARVDQASSAADLGAAQARADELLQELTDQLAVTVRA